MIAEQDLPIDQARPWRERLPAQKRIAIVGKAPDTMRLAPWHDPDWQIWVLNDMAVLAEAPRWDVCFEVHDHPFESENPHRQWLRQRHGKPIFTNRFRAEVPDCVPLPVDEVTACMGRYVNNSVSWMLAVAILAKPEEIALWGVNMACGPGEYGHQRPSCEFFAGVALGRGIRLTVPAASDLLKCGELYGVETNPLQPKMQARRAEVQKRLADARRLGGFLQHQRISLEGMLGELTYWDQFLGGMG